MIEITGDRGRLQEIDGLRGGCGYLLALSYLRVIDAQTVELRLELRRTQGHRSRNPEGSIAVFAVQEDGTLEVVGHAGSGGGTPRMALHPGGEWAIVANQHSDNLVVFAVDPASGMLSNTGMRTSAINTDIAIVSS